MQIQELFVRNIGRPINGVVKADQLDADSVWQELDEFVITSELRKRLNDFFDAYTASLDNPNDPTVSAGMGVWMSGFFGSGKSHLLKVLAHLLRNQAHAAHGQSQQAVKFFEAKITDDGLLLGNIRKAVAPSTEVILFNIDSKASANDGRDAILKVFLKVLNELQGYSPDHPHIAHMERTLDEKGQLPAFQKAFHAATGQDWVKERDAYDFNRDQVLEAFQKATGQTLKSAQDWLDNAEKNFSLSVEKFAQWVKEYLDKKGKGHRLLFFVDEVGQYIGGDTHLMLNLQTITEQLGTVCKGRAWVVVTSQEDIDAVIGEVKTSKANDFSKIQGRFKTRLSLSSANVDEVIQARLLDKTPAAISSLGKIWAQKQDILKHQVELPHTAMTFKSFKTEDDFVRNYPFIPYQFTLLQKVFEALRKVGASGLHLSRGERSILDAFQTAAKQIQERPLGTLAALWRFYPSIEGFLDTAVKRTIDQAKDRGTLSEPDIQLLKSLFLIRYVDEVKGTLDNLVTLSMEEIDQDRIALKGQIEASLNRLEKESLIKRSGDQFIFLTNEEQDISREIKKVDLAPGDDTGALSQLLFDERELLNECRKHRHTGSKVDFNLNRSCDGRPHGNRMEDGLWVRVISPMAEDLDAWGKSRCLLESGQEDGQVLIRMPKNDRLCQELRSMVQTQKYLLRKDDGSQAASTKKILNEVADDNQNRKVQLKKALQEDFAKAEWYVAGQAFSPTGTGAETQLASSVDFLVDSTFGKMKLLGKFIGDQDCKREIQTILRANDAQGQLIAMQLDDCNPKAIAEVRDYLQICAVRNQQVVLEALLSRFKGRPYGWPSLEAAVLLARLLVAGELTLIKDGAPVSADKAYDLLTEARHHRVVQVKKRQASNPAVLQQARKLGNDLLGKQGPAEETPLADFLRQGLLAWQTKLESYRALAEAGQYPGSGGIAAHLLVLKPLTSEADATRFIGKCLEQKEALLELGDDIQNLIAFYETQRPSWDKLTQALQRFQQNHHELEQDANAAKAMQRLGQIRAMPEPYGAIKEIHGLVAQVEATETVLLEAERKKAIQAVASIRALLQKDLTAVGADSALATGCEGPLNQLQAKLGDEKVLGNLQSAGLRAHQVYDAAQAKIAQWAQAKAASKPADKQVVLKPIQTVSATEVAGAGWIEDEAQVEAFLASLRARLMQAVKEGKRVQVR